MFRPDLLQGKRILVTGGDFERGTAAVLRDLHFFRLDGLFGLGGREILGDHGEVQVAFAGTEEDILRAKTPGYMRMLTLSHRFVVPTQARLFEAPAAPPVAAAAAA